jgi:hypothetical protein
MTQSISLSCINSALKTKGLRRFDGYNIRFIFCINSALKTKGLRPGEFRYLCAHVRINSALKTKGLRPGGAIPVPNAAGY